MNDVIRLVTRDERRTIRKQWPAEFDDGIVCGLTGKAEGDREPGGYPKGFHAWPLERRNAWFAGFNLGHAKRTNGDLYGQKI
jgi:hypothetical protein